jgi:hypothetical protein
MWAFSLFQQNLLFQKFNLQIEAELRSALGLYFSPALPSLDFYITFLSFFNLLLPLNNKCHHTHRRHQASIKFNGGSVSLLNHGVSLIKLFSPIINMA